MDQPYFFDQLGENQNSHAQTKPIYSFDLDDPNNEKNILSWLKSELYYLENEAQDRIRNMRRNLALYKGVQYQELESRIDSRDRGADRSNFMRKIVANHLYDLTKNRASRLIKFKPAVAILPTNDEQEDKIAAKSCKYLLDHIWYMEDFEGRLQLALATYAMVMGETYLFIDWNAAKGDISPAYVKAKKKAGETGRIPFLDENGQQVTDPQGNKIWVDDPVRIGDVEYRMKLATELVLEKKQKWESVNYCFEIEPISTDLLRIQYSDKASDIKDTDAQIYDYESMALKPARRQTLKYTFWHKRSEQMDKGRKIVFTKDAILENVEFPFSHRELPCKRFTDVEFPGELHGHSFFETVKQLTGTYNNLTNMIVRNIVLTAHPKWMVPAGSASIDKLGNDVTIVQYKGPTPPALAVAQTTPPEVYNFRAALKEEFQQISGVFGVSRGEPPPGIKAGVALQFLAEQENERYNELVLKWNEFIKGIAQMTLSVAGDYYDDSDERMIRILGKNNAYMTEFFKASYLDKDYDCRIQNSSALPKSVAARTQTLLDLNERFPNNFTAEQIIDMLDLAQSDKFTDGATVSVRAAEAENEKLAEIKESDLAVLAPEEWEDHILHWKIHTRQILEYAFKYQTPVEIQSRFKDHVQAHEMFMVERARLNQAFAAELATLKNFPMFYQIQPMPTMQPMAAPIDQGGTPMAASDTMPPQPFQPMPELPEQLPGEPMTEQAPSIQLQTQGSIPPIEPTNQI